jgi:hypothetical protein
MEKDVESTNQPGISSADVLSLGEKLRALPLSSGEHLALDKILELFKVGAELSTNLTVQELLADLPDGPELLDDVAGFSVPDVSDMGLRCTSIGFTYTTLEHLSQRPEFC